uniref:Translocase of outer mitochondrial membrane 20 n=1 Tax=Astatotilapia calliptera TaxID=8154 RepID=A0AAX7TZG1_ASTCA
SFLQTTTQLVCLPFCVLTQAQKRDGSYTTDWEKKAEGCQREAGLAKLPDLKDAEAVQKFFLEEIQLGEELLAQGDYEKGVDHLTNAIAVCGQPQQLLQVLQQTLPPPVFQMLLTKLPSISQRIVSAQSLSEDDIE